MKVFDRERVERERVKETQVTGKSDSKQRSFTFSLSHSFTKNGNDSLAVKVQASPILLELQRQYNSMEKYLITGAGGFVGRHLSAFLMSLGEPVDILGLDRQFDTRRLQGPCRLESVDLSDRQAFEKIVAGFKPRYVIHLAADSSVAESWRDPASSILNNVTILVNLYEAVRSLVQAGTPCRILSIGSSEVYGRAHADQMPFREKAFVKRTILMPSAA